MKMCLCCRKFVDPLANDTRYFPRMKIQCSFQLNSKMVLFLSTLLRHYGSSCWATGTEDDVPKQRIDSLQTVVWLRLSLYSHGLSHQLFKSFTNRQPDRWALGRWIICSFPTDFYHFKAFKWCPEISLMKPIPNSPKIRNVPILLKVVLNGFEWQVTATAFIKANIRRLDEISE